MTTGYNYGSNVGYNGAGATNQTYAGYGQYAQRVDIPAEFARRLLLPNVVPVFLLTCKVRMQLIHGIVAGGDVRGFAVPDGVTNLVLNGGKEPLDYIQDENDMFVTPGSWMIPNATNSAPIQSYDLLVNPPAGRSFFDDVYMVEFDLHFATRPKTFRDVIWQSRVRTIPNLSFRIESKFSGPGQVGGGKISLNNEDGYFDELDEQHSFARFAGPIYWSGGLVTLEMGLDLATDPENGAMDEADYRTIGTWRVEKTDKSDSEFNLDVRELKSNLELEVPFEQYTRDTFPGIEDATVSQPIPRAYGQHFAIKPTLIDATDRRFSVAHHPIRSFDAVRIQNNVDETRDIEVTDWSLYSGAAYQFVEQREVVNVKFDGDDLVEAKSPEKVVSTQGTWHYRDSVLYVRPPTGETTTSGTYLAAVRTQLTIWQTVNFASVDPQKAQFTLGEDWDRSAPVAVDFSGRMNLDGTLMTNMADVVADLLDYAGEIQFDAQSFAESRRIFRIGLNRWGEEVSHLAPALYLDEKKPLRDTIARLCETAGASFFAGFDGLWRFVAFNPVRGETLEYTKAGLLRRFSEDHILGPIQKTADAREVFSKVTVIYAPRVEEKWHQSVPVSRSVNQYVHNLSDLAGIERKPCLYRREDARYFGQRLCTTEGQELVKYTFTLPLAAYFLLPTEKIHLTHTRYGIDGVLEVLEVNYDLTNSRVKVVAGDQRGWGDSFGYWVHDPTAAVTPTVPADAECWLRADALALVHNARVAQWNDVSGRNRHAIQSNAATQPFFLTNQINGLPAVRFGLYASSQPYQLGVAATDFNVWTEAEGFLVVKAEQDPGASAGNNRLWSLGSGVPQLEDSQYPDSAGVIQENFFTTVTKTAVDPTPALNAWRIYNVSSKNGEFTIRLDGTQIFTTAVNTFGAYATGAFYFGSGQAKHFAGMFAEFILFKRVLTTTERAGVVQYLSDKYGLALVAPTSDVPAWDSAWTNPEAHQARQNYGFWQDANEVADPLDPNRSYRAGRWW